MDEVLYYEKVQEEEIRGRTQSQKAKLLNVIYIVPLKVYATRFMAY